MKNKEFTDYVIAHPQLVHCSNILQKLHTEKDKSKIEAVNALLVQYNKYLKLQEAIKKWDKTSIIKKVNNLNSYLDYYDNNTQHNYNKLFTAQGKLRSTILEEFFYFLFHDYLDSLKSKYKDTHNIINLGAAKAYSNLYFAPADFKSFINEPSVHINLKDQDFAIFRNVIINVDKEVKEAKIPIFAIEVKTWLDKTMLEGSIATAAKIKSGNPYARFVLATESYAVDKSVDPSYSQIDQIYVLRKEYGSRMKLQNPKPIQSDVVIRLFDEMRQHIERPWSDIESKLNNDGVII